MNNKSILICFLSLSLLTVGILTFISLCTFMTLSQPIEHHYNSTINNTYTYNVTNNEIKDEKKDSKKKNVEKKETKKKEVKETKKVEKTNGYTDYEINLLAKLINAEAKGESFNGKVAVGNVVINRVKSKHFPNTIKDVIYQPRQFQPVTNGAINNTPSKESLEAAKKSITTNLIGNALYFYNPSIATDSWIRTRQVTTTIGSHSFAL